MTARQLDAGPGWQCGCYHLFRGLDYLGGDRLTNAEDSAEAPSWECRLRHLFGGIFSFKRDAGHLWRNSGAPLPVQQSRLCCFSSGVDQSGGGKTDDDETIGRQT